MKKWLMTKGATAKITLTLASVLVVAAIGTGIYFGVKPSDKEVAKVVSISEEKAPTTDVPQITDESEKESAVVDGPAEAPSELEDTVEEVRVKEGFDLVNGNFEEGLFAYELYAMNPSDIFYDTNENGLTVRISDTGSEDWHIQLKQNDIRLEQGRWYRLSLDAKSDITRDITYTLMHDGLNDNNWTLYAPQKKITLGKGWQRYSVIFCMNEVTDNHSVFNVSMGTIDGRRITKNHAISLNNITLETLPANFIDSMRNEDNLISNPNFAYEDITWETNVVTPGQALVSFADNKATFNITNPGTLDWHVQLKQGGISLYKDQCYRLTFDAASSVARTIKVGIMDTNYTNWYGGGEIATTPEKQTVTVEFQNTIAADSNALLMLSMGKIEGEETPASTITLENFSLVKIDALSGEGSSNPTTVYHDGWELYDHEGKHVKESHYAWDDGFVVNIADTGSETWHVQLTKKPIKLEKGKTYKFTFEGKTSSVKRDITYMVQHNGNLDNKWDTYTTNNKAELTQEWKKFEQIFTMPADDENSVINFSMGYDNSDPYTWFAYIGDHTVCIRNVSIGEVTLDDMSLLEAMEFGAYEGAKASDEYKDGTRTISITNNGTAEWHVQMKQAGLTLEEGKTYRIAFDVQSSIDRQIQYSFQDASYNAYFAEWGLQLTANEWVNVDKTFKMEKATDKAVSLGFSMGSVPTGTTNIAHTIAIKNLVFEETEEQQDPVYNEKTEKGYIIKPTHEKEGGNWVLRLDPSAYGVANPQGKDLVVSLKVNSADKYSGQVGCCRTSSWAWSDTQFESEGGETEVTFEVSDYMGELQLQLFSFEAESIEITDISVAEKVAADDSDDDKVMAEVGEFELDPYAYGLEGDLNGKTIKVTINFAATGDFNGAIGGNDGGNWTYADCSGTTWTRTFESFGYGLKYAVWYIAEGAEVEITGITLEDITPIPIVVSADDSTVTADEAPIVDKDGKKWQLYFGGEGYEELVGKTVTFSADLQSDSYYGGKIIIQSHSDYSGWNDSEQYEVNGDGDVSHWTVTAEDFTQAFIQIYWRDEEHPCDIYVTNIKFEVVEEESTEGDENNDNIEGGNDVEQ